MTGQTSLGRPVVIQGPGLHTGRSSRVTLYPAPADHGWRIAKNSGPTVAVEWTRWVPSRMSTSIGLDAGGSIRTTEHMMSALVGLSVDNVRIVVEGDEIPILDGSARGWCRAVRDVGIVPLAAPRRAIRVRRAVTVARDGGFLSAEPADGFSLDVTHDVLPAFPVMRWAGSLDAGRFERDLAPSRSFGDIHRRLGLSRGLVRRPASIPPFVPNQPRADAKPVEEPWHVIALRKVEADPRAPLLKGWRPWRATLVIGSRLVPIRRFADEPGRHVVLDMIGDLALAGRPLIGRFVAHNPSHEKTYALVAALLGDPANYEFIDAVT